METFGTIAIGTAFRALRNDVIGKGEAARIVNNDGLYVKVGTQVAVDLSHGNKDCVFLQHMPVRRIKSVVHIDYHNLDAFKAGEEIRKMRA